MRPIRICRVLSGQTAPKKDVVANSFTLVGPDGKVRGGMGTAKSGASIFLKDAAGGNRIHMTVTKKGVPAISLNDAAGKTRMSLGVANDGITFVALKDSNSKIRSFLFLTPDGTAKMRFKDAKGKKIKDLP